MKLNIVSTTEDLRNSSNFSYTMYNPCNQIVPTIRAADHVNDERTAVQILSVDDIPCLRLHMGLRTMYSAFQIIMGDT